MRSNLTLAEMLFATALCLLAMGSARADDSSARERKNDYKIAIAHADADYKAAKEACKSSQGNDRDVCMKQAKADHIKATEDAKARLKSRTAMADAREDTEAARYKVAREKCDALSGEAKDRCIDDAKLRYHQ